MTKTTRGGGASGDGPAGDMQDTSATGSRGADDPAAGRPPSGPRASGDRLHRWQEHYSSTSGTPFHAGQEPSAPLVAELRGHDGAGRRALDLACGAGRHSIWLAEHGWQVFGVDFSPAGIDRAREAAAALPAGIRPAFAVADLATWNPPPGPSWDLVLCTYFHLAELLERMPGWLAPSGRIIVITHAPDSPRGPRNPAFRPTVQQLRAALEASGVELEYLRAAAVGDPEVDLVNVVHAVRR